MEDEGRGQGVKRGKAEEAGGESARRDARLGVEAGAT